MERQNLPVEFLIRRTNKIDGAVTEKALSMLSQQLPCEAKVDTQNGREKCNQIPNAVVYWQDKFGPEYWMACGWDHVRTIEEMAVSSLITNAGYSINTLPAFAIIESKSHEVIQSVEPKFKIFPEEE